MEYQKIINLLENAPNSQIKFKITILKSTLYNYSDVYMLIKWNIRVNKTGTAAPTNRNEK